MFTRLLLRINLVVSSLIALLFIGLPGPTLALYGLQGDAPTLAIAQYFGTAHVAFAVLIWLALTAKSLDLTRAVVVSFFAGDLAGSIVLLIIQTRGTMNAMGWGLVGLSSLFAIGYGYCVLSELRKGA